MSDQTLDIPFIGGPDDQTDPRLLPAGSVVSAFNQVYDLDGSYQPRFGYVALGNALANLRKLHAFGDELVAIDGAQMWTLDPSVPNFVAKDVVPAPGVTHRPLFNTSTSFLSWNEATGLGYRVVAWIDGVDSTTLVRAAVYNVATGAMVLGPVQVSASARPTEAVRVAVSGNVVLVAWVDVIATVVAGCTIDLTNVAAGFGVPTTLSDLTNLMIDATYEFTLCATDTIFIVSYETNPVGGTHIGQIQCVSRLQNLTLQNSQKNAVAAHYYQSISMASVAKDGGDLWVVVSAIGYIADSAAGVPTVWAMRVNPATMVASAGPIDCGSGTHIGIAKTGVDIVSGHAGQAVVTYSGTSGMFANWITVSGPVFGTAKLVPNVVQACTPIYCAALDCTYVYCNTVALYAGTLGVVWGSYFLVNLGSSAAPKTDLCGIFAPRIVNDPGLGNTSKWAHTPRAFFTDATIYGPESSVIEALLPIIDNRGRTGIDIFKADFLAPFRWSPASLGRENYLSGQVYDGNLVSEIGFAANPFVTGVTGSGSGSFTGTWEYAVTFGRINAQGDLEESAPSIPVEVTASSNAQFNINVVALTLSQKWRTAYGTASGTASPVYIIVYRTQALSAGDTLHYRVFNEPFPVGILNDPTTAIITIVDTVTDSDLTDGTHPVLYTDSTELPHNAPETFTHSCVHKNRLVGIGADQRTIWISQTYSEGVTPAFNELVTLTVDDTSEPLTAVASLYDKLLVFTPTRIYVVYGDGPAISGAGNDYTQPQRIPSTSGCIDPRSVVNTPMGVMFQGLMGLMLVDTGLGVTFIGNKVSGALAPYPTCVSAHWCEDSSTVRFGFTADDAEDARATTGVLACYDVRRSRWAIHQLTNFQANASVLPGGAPISAAAWHPTLGYVTGYNMERDVFAAVAREATLDDPAPWLDYGTFFVPLQVTPAPIKGSDGSSTKLQGAQRFRRVRLLGQFYEAHGLSVGIGYDYGEPSEAHEYSSADVLGFVVGSREQVRCIPQYGKGEALQVTLSTVEPDPHPATYTGRGAGFTGVQVEIHTRTGGYRNLGAGAKS